MTHTNSEFSALMSKSLPENERRERDADVGVVALTRTFRMMILSATPLLFPVVQLGLVLGLCTLRFIKKQSCTARLKKMQCWNRNCIHDI